MGDDITIDVTKRKSNEEMASGGACPRRGRTAATSHACSIRGLDQKGTEVALAGADDVDPVRIAARSMMTLESLPPTPVWFAQIGRVESIRAQHNHLGDGNARSLLPAITVRQKSSFGTPPAMNLHDVVGPQVRVVELPPGNHVDAAFRVPFLDLVCLEIHHLNVVVGDVGQRLHQPGSRAEAERKQ